MIRQLRAALSGRVRRERTCQALDQALGRGEDPGESLELALRARELERPDTRNRIANSLLNLVDAAEEPASTWRTHGVDPPLRSEAVLSARHELVALAEALRAADAAGVRGIALASQLVRGSSSPIYSWGAGADLTITARQAREAIEASVRTCASSR